MGTTVNPDPADQPIEEIDLELLDKVAGGIHWGEKRDT